MLSEVYKNLIYRMVKEEFNPESLRVEADVAPIGSSYYIEMVLKEKPEEVEYRLTEIVNEVEMSFYQPTSFQIVKDGDYYIVRATFVNPEANAYALALA